MSIRAKVFAIVLFLFATLGVADFVVQRFVIYPSFLDLERHEAGENLQRIFQAIDRETYHLERLSRDWAIWDDTHDFMTTGTMAYIESNLDEQSLENISLNVLVFCSTNGTVVWSRVRDVADGEKKSLEFMAGNTIDPGHPTLAVGSAEGGGKGKTGILGSEHGPLLFATREILHSDGSGPAAGYLVMGRFLRGKMLTAIKDQTRIDFEIVHPFSEADIMCDVNTPYTSGTLTYFTQPAGEYIKICAAYRDPIASALFGVQYLFPREITQKGIASIRYAMLLVIGSGAIVLVMLNVLLQIVVVRPLQRLTSQAARITREGDFSMRLSLNRRDEIGELANSFDALVQTVRERTRELKHANDKLTTLSMRDPMTGIANRRMFDETLKQEWRRAMRDQTPISVILADVDHFKNYNDTHGHQHGDQCLIAVAAVLQGQMQRPGDLAARYGGEEFVIVLPDTDEDGARHMAETLRQSVLDLRMEHGASETGPFVTISLGTVTMVPSLDEGDNGMDQLLGRADQALYLAKKAGRNQTAQWTPDPTSVSGTS
jgi:diguanylate cyclase (GGDEF)-like protein